jgi:hypothetical protein
MAGESGGPATALGLRESRRQLALGVGLSLTGVALVGIGIAVGFSGVAGALSIVSVLLGVTAGFVALGYGLSLVEQGFRRANLPLAAADRAAARSQVRRSEWIWVAGFALILVGELSRLAPLDFLGIAVIGFSCFVYFRTLAFERSRRRLDRRAAPQDPPGS